MLRSLTRTTAPLLKRHFHKSAALCSGKDQDKIQSLLSEFPDEEVVEKKEGDVAQIVVEEAPLAPKRPKQKRDSTVMIGTNFTDEQIEKYIADNQEKLKVAKEGEFE